ncbi:MAG: hypothetical protein IPG68_01755 [Micrococcales bacterium]|nr:hypothetical protein [Micrococcales bacterium]
MSFDDLPADWPDMSLTDPAHIADVLDLFVSMQARFDGALFILVCDEQHRPVQPIQIDGVRGGPPDDAHSLMSGMARTVAEVQPQGSVLCAIARRGSPMTRRSDLAWRDHITAAFGEHMPVIGVHVVTPEGSRLIHAAAA